MAIINQTVKFEDCSAVVETNFPYEAGLICLGCRDENNLGKTFSFGLTLDVICRDFPEYITLRKARSTTGEVTMQMEAVACFQAHITIEKIRLTVFTTNPPRALQVLVIPWTAGASTIGFFSLDNVLPVNNLEHAIERLEAVRGWIKTPA